MADSTHAVWLDPLSFDLSENGPPYLPERTKVASHRVALDDLLAPFEGMAGAELGALVALLRAASMVHQSHHWQTRGSTFYGDHLLLDRLYSESVGFIDQVAERAVGLGDRDVVCPKIQSALIDRLVQLWCSGPFDGSALGLMQTSLGVERAVLTGINAVKGRMQARASLTEGTDNLLQGIADKHEEFAYLLQQRVTADGYSYDAR